MLKREKQKMQVHEFFEGTIETGHISQDDYTENKLIQDEDFVSSVVSLLKKGVFVPRISEVQSCYR